MAGVSSGVAGGGAAAPILAGHAPNQTHLLLPTSVTPTRGGGFWGQGGQDPNNSTVMTNGTSFIYPIFLPYDLSITKLIVKQGGSTSAGGTCYVGVYASDTDFLPTGTAVATASFDTGSSTGIKTLSVTSFDVSAGEIYWVMISVDSGGAGFLIMMGLDVYNGTPGSVGGIMIQENGFTATVAMKKSSGGGAIPDPAPTITTAAGYSDTRELPTCFMTE